MTRPDLTNILIRLVANDWIEVEEQNGNRIELHEGKFTVLTPTHIGILIHQGNCKFMQGRIKIEDILKITITEDKCPEIIAKS